MKRELLVSTAKELIKVLGLVDSNKKPVVVKLKATNEELKELITQAAEELEPQDKLTKNTISVLEDLGVNLFEDELEEEEEEDKTPPKKSKVKENDEDDEDDEDAEDDEDDEEEKPVKQDKGKKSKKAPVVIENEKEPEENKEEEIETKSIKKVKAKKLVKEKNKRTNAKEAMNYARTLVAKDINLKINDVMKKLEKKGFKDVNKASVQIRCNEMKACVVILENLGKIK